MLDYKGALAKLEKYGQEHVLAHFDSLDAEQKSALLGQIAQTDLSPLVSAVISSSERGKITPMPALELSEIEKKREKFEKAGVEALAAGKIGAVLLAGGMGTRLGSDSPKGTYDIGKTRPVYIFERLFSNLLDTVHACGKYIYLFIMTSEKNDAQTRAFLAEHDYFGYAPEFVRFFMQQTAPATDYSGKIYMESPFRMSTSPNGNGGWYVSLLTAGLRDAVREAGIEWLDVFAVDNVLQRIADPAFVGATLLSGTCVGAKVIRKNAPDEHVGVLCYEDGKPSIVEYYELTEELMTARDSRGEPAYNFGVILNYLFRVCDLDDISDKKLPLHRVEKKISHMNASGETVKPEKPNGYKYENLVLDMIHMLDSCLPYEVVREKEFAPIKNKTGIDSVESAQALLEGCGFKL